MLKLRSYLTLCACLTLSLLAGEPAKPSAKILAIGSAAQGKIEYQQMCGGCHDGGAAGPVLKGQFKRKKMRDKKRTLMSEAAVRARITDGGDGMPPFASLKPKQLDDLIAYLKTL